MKKSKKVNQWEENEKRAKAMVTKFINVLKTLDCYSSWESLLLEGLHCDTDKDAEEIADAMESVLGCVVLHSDSIITDMKIEAFKQSLSENPYQLQLI